MSPEVDDILSRIESIIRRIVDDYDIMPNCSIMFVLCPIPNDQIDQSMVRENSIFGTIMKIIQNKYRIDLSTISNLSSTTYLAMIVGHGPCVINDHYILRG